MAPHACGPTPLVPGVRIALSQAQGVGHELMTLVLIAAEPRTCTDVPGKADPHRHIPALFQQRYVTELPPVPAAGGAEVSPSCAPRLAGTSGIWEAEMCAVSQDQHSAQAGPPRRHRLGWLCLGEGAQALAASWGCLGQSATV